MNVDTFALICVVVTILLIVMFVLLVVYDFIPTPPNYKIAVSFGISIGVIIAGVISYYVGVSMNPSWNFEVTNIKLVDSIEAFRRHSIYNNKQLQKLYDLNQYISSEQFKQNARINREEDFYESEKDLMIKKIRELGLPFYVENYLEEKVHKYCRKVYNDLGRDQSVTVCEDRMDYEELLEDIAFLYHRCASEKQGISRLLKKKEEMMASDSTLIDTYPNARKEFEDLINS